MKKYRFNVIVLAIAVISLRLYFAFVTAEDAQASANIDPTRWKDVYVNEYCSWQEGVVQGSERVGKPVTMTYAIQNSPRISAGCAGCHSTAFVNIYALYGGDVVNLDELELIAESRRSEGINCYSCHGDSPGEMYVSKAYITDAAKAGGLDPGDPNLVCAQCHALTNRAWEEELISFKEDLSVGVMGDTDVNNWSTLSAGTNAEDVYAWFTAHGEKNPKVIPGEMGFQQYHGSVMDQAGVSCAACHMEKVTSEDGSSYTRHMWQGANVNPAIYQNCISCHQGTADEMQKHVLEIQAAYQKRLIEVKAVVSDTRFAIQSSGADQVTRETATSLWFEARFYYHYGQDTSNGIHGIGNPNTSYCFDKCLEICDRINAML